MRGYTSEDNSSTEELHEASAFLKKTYAILMDKSNNHIISWSTCGTRFSIIDHDKFANEILPKHFKHNNTKSFVRQLNIHGFKKFSVKSEKGKDYYNENFRRGKPDLLNKIERVSVKNKEEAPASSKVYKDLIEENSKLKNKIQVLESKTTCQPTPVSVKDASTLSLTTAADNEPFDLGEEETQAILRAARIYAKVRKQQSTGATNFIPLEEMELFDKTRDLLMKIQGLNLKQATSLESTESSQLSNSNLPHSGGEARSYDGCYQGESSGLGKRSSFSGSELCSQDIDETETTSWYNHDILNFQSPNSTGLSNPEYFWEFDLDLCI